MTLGTAREPHQPTFLRSTRRGPGCGTRAKIPGWSRVSLHLTTWRALQDLTMCRGPCLRTAHAPLHSSAALRKSLAVETPRLGCLSRLRLKDNWGMEGACGDAVPCISPCRGGSRHNADTPQVRTDMRAPRALVTRLGQNSFFPLRVVCGFFWRCGYRPGMTHARLTLFACFQALLCCLLSAHPRFWLDELKRRLVMASRNGGLADLVAVNRRIYHAAGPSVL